MDSVCTSFTVNIYVDYNLFAMSLLSLLFSLAGIPAMPASEDGMRDEDITTRTALESVFSYSQGLFQRIDCIT